jgi:uncharacterized phosphosugar-binding protein
MVTSPSVRFFTKVQELMEVIKQKEQEKIVKAAQVMADCIASDRMIHISGSGGHSSIIAEDALYRKGGLACVNPILDPTFSLSHGAVLEINHMEGLYDVTPVLIDYYGLEEGDVFILGSAWGIACQAVDLALSVKERGLTLIAITCGKADEYTDKYHPNRHKSGKVIADIADIFIDNHAPHGDGCVDIDGFDKKVAPISTILQCAIYQSLVAETVDLLVKRGIAPPIWTNAFELDGAVKNKSYIKKYGSRAKSL